MRTVAEITSERAALLNRLPKLAAELKLAKASELRAQLAAVEVDYRAGVDLEKIRTVHSVTTGQIAGWARRLGWSRPPERVGSLSAAQATIYRDLRADRPKADAVRIASEASAHARPAQSTWGDRKGDGAIRARLSGAPTSNRSPARSQAPDRFLPVGPSVSSAGERYSAHATKPINNIERRHRPEVGSG
jgi:hypothetical protein